MHELCIIEAQVKLIRNAKEKAGRYIIFVRRVKDE